MQFKDRIVNLLLKYSLSYFDTRIRPRSFWHNIYKTFPGNHDNKSCHRSSGKNTRIQTSLWENTITWDLYLKPREKSSKILSDNTFSEELEKHTEKAEAKIFGRQKCSWMCIFHQKKCNSLKESISLTPSLMHRSLSSSVLLRSVSSRASRRAFSAWYISLWAFSASICSGMFTVKEQACYWRYTYWLPRSVLKNRIWWSTVYAVTVCMVDRILTTHHHAPPLTVLTNTTEWLLH